MGTFIILLALIIIVLQTSKTTKLNSQNVSKSRFQVEKLTKAIENALFFSAHGKVDERNDKTRFDQGENITYTKFLTFVGRSNKTFNLTTGVFKTASSGIYEFTFYGYCDGSTQIEVYKNTVLKLIFKNNNQISKGNTNFAKRRDDSSLGQMWHMKLEQGVMIYLKVGQGYVAKYHDYTFSVNLIRNIY